MKTYKITVSGVVQGVGYRYFCYKKALEFNVSGYARNLANGNVEVAAQGNDGLVSGFINELKVGPRYSQVKSVNIEQFEDENEYSQFSIY